jgi:hypothetical protein
VDTDVFLEGVSKSDAARDVEVGLKVVLGTTESSPVPVKLTVVQSEYAVTIQAFIPYLWVDVPYLPFVVPLDTIAVGDNRSYDPTLNATFRCRESFTVTPFEDLSPARIKQGSIEGLAGLSIHYDKSDSVPASEQSQSHGYSFVNNPRETARGQGTTDAATAGPVQRIDSKRFTFKAHMAAYEGVIGQNSQPILWNLNFGFDVTALVQARVLMDGTRRGFPAYEIYIRNSNGQNLPIYQWSPPADRGVGSLFITEPVAPPNQTLELWVP